jgi:hypothetical protein
MQSIIMPQNNHESLKTWIKKKQFDKNCTDYMEKFGFEWVEEFTLNGA